LGDFVPPLILATSAVLALLAMARIPFTVAARLNQAARRGAAAFRERRFVEAERWYRQASVLSERCFGAESWRTGFQIAALGEVLTAQKRYDEAEKLFEKALARRPSVTSPSSAVLFSMVYVSASTLAVARGDGKRALELLQEARTLAEPSGGGQLAVIDLQRAALLRQLGDLEAAEALVRTVDPRHMPQQELARVGRARLQAGDGEGAVVLLRLAVERERARSESSGSLALLRSLVAEGLELAGRHAEAQVAMTLSIQTYEALSAHALVVVPLLVKLARIELACGNAPAAEAACHRAIERAAPPAPSGAPYREASVDDPLAASRSEASCLLAEASAMARRATA
jgi:tetratricopeptide (TPR) repeat protein